MAGGALPASRGGSGNIYTTFTGPTAARNYALPDANATILTSVNSLLYGFSAYNSSNDLDVTGDGTTYTILCNSEIFDIGSNYDGTTGIFTAPVTGKYMFTASVILIQVTVLHTEGYIELVTSNRTYTANDINPGAIIVPGGFVTLQGTFIADMDAADIAKINLTVSGSTKTVDVRGDAVGVLTYFQGYFIG